MDMVVRSLVPALILFLIGCEGTNAPAQKARPIDDGPVAEVLPPIVAPKPEKSEPAAALAVNAILMAHADNEPSRVEKLRKVRVRRKGEWKLPDGSRSDASMDIAIWGDQYRATFAISVAGNIPETLSIHRDGGWRFQSRISPKEVPLDPAALEAVLPEVYGDRMTVLAPLLSNKLIAVVARDGREGGETILRVWIDNEPPMLLHVDPKTNRLQRLTYELKENNQVVARVLRFSEHVSIAGVLLPGRVEYGVGPLTFTTWNKIEYEVPGQFELSFFDKP